MSDVVEPNVEPAAPATEPTPTSYENFGQFIDQYAGDEYKDAGTWGKFRDTDPATALKAIVDMDRYTGKKGDIPQEGATPEELADFAKKLGFEGSDEPQAYVELDAGKFGDQKSDLEGMYNEGINGIMQAAMANFAEDPSPAAFAKALTDWAQNDANSSVTNELENQAAAQQQATEVAQKLGITPDVMTKMNDEVVAKYGWNADTSIHEVLNTLAKETTNSNTLKESLVSTPVGKASRMSELLNDPAYWDGSNPKLVAEYKQLFNEQMQNS